MFGSAKRGALALPERKESITPDVLLCADEREPQARPKQIAHDAAPCVTPTRGNLCAAEK
jgi:hypothetical protein